MLNGLGFVSVNASFAAPFKESRHSSGAMEFLREEKVRCAKEVFCSSVYFKACHNPIQTQMQNGAQLLLQKIQLFLLIPGESRDQM